MNTDVSAKANPYAPPRAVVRDIADPSVKCELASRGDRFGANFVDSLLFGLIVYVPFILLASMADGGDDPAALAYNAGVVFGVALIAFVVWMWFTIRLINRNGQSIGKKLTGIKIVMSDGSPASVGRIIWRRNVLNAFLSLIPLYGFIDALFIFAADRRCLHDKLADTIVVKA